MEKVYMKGLAFAKKKKIVKIQLREAFQERNRGT